MQKAMVCALFPLLFICCNPLGPSSTEVVQGLSMEPYTARLHLGEEQRFVLSSRRGRLDEVRILMLGVDVYDGECACNRSIKLGRLERVNDSTLIYYAPTSVRSSIVLPRAVEFVAAHGDTGHGADYETLGYVTIVP